jgi:hypothetical protein
MSELLIIKSPMQTVDLQTGEVVKEETIDWHVLPPDTSGGKCPECAVVHDSTEPHDNQSLAYQYSFRARHGRWPTWADAIAHCAPEVQALWKAELIKRDKWSEPEPEALR